MEGEFCSDEINNSNSNSMIDNIYNAYDKNIEDRNKLLLESLFDKLYEISDEIDANSNIS